MLSFFWKCQVWEERLQEAENLTLKYSAVKRSRYVSVGEQRRETWCLNRINPSQEKNNPVKLLSATQFLKF